MKKFYIVNLLVIFLIFISCAQSVNAKKEMIKVEGGSFIMGKDGIKWNMPHEVMLDTFYVAKYPVTVKEWKIFLKETKIVFNWTWEEPESFEGKFSELMPSEDCPIQGLNWYYAVLYCNWLSNQEGLKPAYKINGLIRNNKSEPEVIWDKNSNGYRLPTDAEWEYAARGGKLSKDYIFAGSNNPDEIAKYNQKKSYPVGIMKPNELGLYDMTGNVMVWCWDWFDTEPWTWLPKNNPSINFQNEVQHNDITNTVPMKVVRGGYWGFIPLEIISRDHYAPKNISWIGIRLVRSTK